MFVCVTCSKGSRVRGLSVREQAGRGAKVLMLDYCCNGLLYAFQTNEGRWSRVSRISVIYVTSARGASSRPCLSASPARGFGVLGSELRVLGVGLGFGVLGFGFRVQDLGFRV